MKYTLARRTSQEDKILTYYKTDLQIDAENLNILENQIKREIKEPLEIAGVIKMALVTDMTDNTYTALLIEPMSAPYIKKLRSQFEV